MKTRFTFLLAAIIFSISCTSVEKLIDQGNYDTAIAKLHRKMTGKKTIPVRHLQAFSEVYAKINARDLNQIQRLESSNRSEAWKEILQVYDNLDFRQEKTKAILSELEKYRPEVNIDFLNLTDDRRNAERQYLSILGNEVDALMDLASQGDKNAAREAYYKAQDFQDFQFSEEMRIIEKEARSLGITRVAVYFRNYSDDLLTNEALSDLENLNLPNQEWLVFQNEENTQGMDFHLFVEVQESFWTPEILNQRNYVDRKEVKGGFEYILDENGNVKKDSLGNDIKVPVFEKVKARLTEISQDKKFVLQVDLRVEDRWGKELQVIPLTSEVVFHNRYATFSGDERALSHESKKLIRNLPLPFPGEFQMLIDGIQQMKPIIVKEIDKIRLYQLDI